MTTRGRRGAGPGSWAGAGAGQPGAPAPKVSPLLFRLGRRHPGRRPGLRGGDEPRGVRRLRHPLLPQLPGEPRRAPRGSFLPPPRDPRDPQDPRDRGRRTVPRLTRGGSFCSQGSPPSFHPAGRWSASPSLWAGATQPPATPKAGMEVRPSGARGGAAAGAASEASVRPAPGAPRTALSPLLPRGAEGKLRPGGEEARARGDAHAQERIAVPHSSGKGPLGFQPCGPRCAASPGPSPAQSRVPRPCWGVPFLSSCWSGVIAPGAPHFVFALHTGRRSR